jgi:two-component system nitrate/nitrite response regulator NarL
VSKNTATIIVATSALLREGIASFLQNTPYKIVATAAGSAELTRISYPLGGPTLAIVGMENENLDETAESIRVLRSLMPDGKVALLVGKNGAIDVRRVLTLSPDACIFNPGSRDILIKIFELTFMDQRVIVLSDSTATTASAPASKTPSYTHDLADPAAASLTSLSPRERQIVISLAEGKSNKAIARLYNLSEATVKVHLKAILRKTNTHNRTQAAIWAIQRGFLDHFFEHSRVTDAPSLAPVGQPVTIRSVASGRTTKGTAAR